MSISITARSIFALLLAMIFLLLALAGGPSNGLDVTVAEWFGQFRADAPEAAHWSAWLTVIGSAPVTLCTALIAATWLLAKNMRGRAVLLATTVLLTRFSVELMKDGFARPRPVVEHLPAS